MPGDKATSKIAVQLCILFVNVWLLSCMPNMELLLHHFLFIFLIKGE